MDHRRYYSQVWVSSYRSDCCTSRSTGQKTLAAHDDGDVLPIKVLIPLLYMLRSACLSKSVQNDLRLAKKMCISLQCGHQSSFLAEAREILARVQRPVFKRLGIPDPPMGLLILLKSITAHEANPHVVNIGNQFVTLMGKLGDITLITDDDDAAAAYLQCASAVPMPPEASVSIRPSNLQGEGLYALHDFKVGQQIFQETALALLDCSSADFKSIFESAFVAMDGVSTGSNINGSPLPMNRQDVEKVLHTSLWRGPPSSNKSKVCNSLALTAGVDDQRSEMAGLAEALCVFAFNAYAIADEGKYVLYKFICKANHSCLPNAAVIVDTEGVGQLVCLEPIAADEEITVSYLGCRELGLSQRERTRSLQRGWEFVCSCQRCRSEATAADKAAEQIRWQFFTDSSTSRIGRSDSV